MPGEVIYGVFVSSTYEDLREERAEVQKALLKLHCMPIGMELFGSADEETWDFIKRQIDGCDYYVVVIADKYGSTDEDGVSYTEKEYDYARELKKPVLSFIHGNRKSIRRDKTEDDAIKRDKLEAFIEKVRRSPVGWFTSPDDLAKEVLASFVNERDRRPATGFIRADQAPDLKKYADLLEENARLREEIAKTRELRIIPFPHALKKTTIGMNVLLTPDSSPEPYMLTIRWQYLFTLFVEQILTGKKESWRLGVVEELAESVFDDLGEKYDVEKLNEIEVYGPDDPHEMDEIYLYFIGLGLLEGPDSNPRLTEYGQRQYGLLNPLYPDIPGPRTDTIRKDRHTKGPSRTRTDIGDFSSLPSPATSDC